MTFQSLAFEESGLSRALRSVVRTTLVVAGLAAVAVLAVGARFVAFEYFHGQVVGQVLSGLVGSQ